MLKVVLKVWGREEWIVNNDAYCGKQLILRKGCQCSLHRHPVKRETFYVAAGMVSMEVGDRTFTMMPGDSVDVAPGTWHRFSGLRDSVIFEFSTHHDDADVERAAGEESRAMAP
jgi:mannose-6-phosphate isomerase-like protein (cupin superfamily)